jgi:hypothetical protein
MIFNGSFRSASGLIPIGASWFSTLHRSTQGKLFPNSAKVMPLCSIRGPFMEKSILNNGCFRSASGLMPQGTLLFNTLPRSTQGILFPNSAKVVPLCSIRGHFMEKPTLKNEVLSRMIAATLSGTKRHYNETGVNPAASVVPLYARLQRGGPSDRVQHEVVYEMDSEENIIWSEERMADVPQWELDLKKQAEALVDDSGKILQDKLVKLIQSSSKSCSPEWADFVGRQTNFDQTIYRGEPVTLALQQLVYTTVTALLYCFNPVKYIAFRNDEALSVRPLQDKNHVHSYRFQPGAAILATEKHCVLATMELNVYCDVLNMVKCVLATSESAISFRAAGVTSKIRIPFIVGSGERVRLYVTELDVGSNVPEVVFLDTAYLFDKIGRVRLVTKLAVLLSEITKVMDSAEGLKALISLVEDPSGHKNFWSTYSAPVEDD